MTGDLGKRPETRNLPFRTELGVKTMRIVAIPTCAS